MSILKDWPVKDVVLPSPYEIPGFPAGSSAVLTSGVVNVRIGPAARALKTGERLALKIGECIWASKDTTFAANESVQLRVVTFPGGTLALICLADWLEALSGLPVYQMGAVETL